MTQVTEKHFRESFIHYFSTSATIEKKQVNPLAHTDVNADYFIQTKDFDILVECKEVLCVMTKRESKPQFVLDRFTQNFKMNKFVDSFPRNRAYLFLCFWHGRKDNSFAYLIPPREYNKILKLWNKKSLNEIECFNLFENFLIDWTYERMEKGE